MTNDELQQLVCDISWQHFQKPFQHNAYFNARLRTTGGRYLLSSHHIEINPTSYEMFGLSELIGIIKHELCHYHLHIEGKGYQHKDQDFKRLLATVGAPRFCSTIQKPRISTIQHEYICTACGVVYKRKRRINVEKYRCGKCHGKLFKKK
jgi:SprT-like protein